MKTHLILLVCLLTTIQVRAQYSFIYQHADEYPNGNSRVSAVADDNHGNSYMAGNFTISLTLGNITLTNPTNITGYYGKINNATSTWIWAKKITLVTTSGTLAYISSSDIRDIASDVSGNLYLIGSYIGGIKIDNISLTSTKTNGSFVYYDMYVAKINANGTCAWAKSFGTKNGGDWGQAIGLDAAGNVYFNAEFEKAITCSGSAGLQSDITVVKLNNAGTLLWQKQFATSTPCDDSPAVSGAIAVDAAGNSYITGDFVGTVNFGSGPGLSITSSGLRDIYIAKLNSSGASQWARSAGTATTNDKGNGIYVDGSGNVYAGGNMGAGTTYVASFLAKYNSLGSLTWSVDPFPYSSFQSSDGVFRLNFDNGALLATSQKVGFKSVSPADGSVISSDSLIGNFSTGQLFIRDVASTGSGYVLGVDDRCGTVDLANLTLDGSCSDCNGCGATRANIQLISHANSAAIVNPGLPDDHMALSPRSSDTEIILYPNPSRGEFIISSPATVDQKVGLKIYNSIGQLLQSFEVTDSAFHFGNQFQPGLYYAETNMGGERKMTKILKVE